ncbi:hypothetical protein GCM10027295_25390 [Pseudaeromonas pectinilytica]
MARRSRGTRRRVARQEAGRDMDQLEIATEGDKCTESPLTQAIKETPPPDATRQAVVA